jgi:hypothetical protein
MKAALILFIVVGALASAGVLANLQALGVPEAPSACAGLAFPVVFLVVVGLIITRR